MRERVVATGIGIVTPLRPFMGLDSFWNALCAGEDAITVMEPPFLELGRKWPMAAIERSAFPNEMRTEEKAGFLAEEALKMAMHDSGLDIGSAFNMTGAGITVGTVLGNMLYKEVTMSGTGFARPDNEKKDRHKDGYNDSLSSLASGLADKYRLSGPVITVSTACASGTDALGIAAGKIRTGQADIMIAGGIDVLSSFALSGFHSLQALTHDKVRPFDRNRDGLALGEGAAFIIIESEKHARERGARIYAGVSGYASRADANHLTGPHREGRGLSAAIRAAFLDAEMDFSELDYINAHGTGTPYNDLMETKAIKNVFGETAYRIPVSSTKSMLGHSFGAAGVIEAICCMLAIRSGVVPPTINFHEKDTECDLDYTVNVAAEKKVRVAMSQSAGFGGQNSAVVFAQA
jgi:3-oxoacyl-[acyl-carrier-protein] synthase II